MSATDTVTIRLGRAEDMPIVFDMIKEAADVSGAPAYEPPTIQQLLADLFESDPPWCGVLVAELGGTALGALAYQRSYWSFSGRTFVAFGLHVSPSARRKGLGRRLVLEMCRLGLAESAQVDWVIPRDSEAEAFIAQFGAVRNGVFDDHHMMRMPFNSITLAASEHFHRGNGSRGVHNQGPDTNETVTIRRASRNDMAAMIDMINELATFQGKPEGPQLTVKDLVEDGLTCSVPWFFAYVAELGGAVVGMVIGTRPWNGSRVHYLQNLYVRPSARRRGVADHLIREFCKFSLKEGVEHVDLHVAHDNPPAQQLYLRLQASEVPARDILPVYRLTRNQIKDIVLQSSL